MESPKQRYYRKVIKISATDSPNVQLALEEKRRGLPVSNTMILPGVIDWYQYQKRLQTWDPIRKCIGLDGDFYEGSEVLLFPPLWLNRAEEVAVENRKRTRHARAMGVDPAEGGDSSVWTIVDEWGIIKQISMKTPNTAVVTAVTIKLIHEFHVSPERVMFDRGGGGKEHADRLESQGFRVQYIGFGETVTLAPKRGLRQIDEKIELLEERYAYKNRRAEMYVGLSMLLDPDISPGFGIPAEYTELRRQLAPLPKWYDPEGRLFLPPKKRASGERESDKVTIDKLIGCSPDEADSLVLAVYSMQNKPRRNKATAV